MATGGSLRTRRKKQTKQAPISKKRRNEWKWLTSSDDEAQASPAAVYASTMTQRRQFVVDMHLGFNTSKLPPLLFVGTKLDEMTLGGTPSQTCMCDLCVGDLYTCDHFFHDDLPMEAHNFSYANVADDAIVLHWPDDGVSDVVGVPAEQLQQHIGVIARRLGKGDISAVCADLDAAVRFGRVFSAELAVGVLRRKLDELRRHFGKNFDRGHPIYVRGLQSSKMFVEGDNSHSCIPVVLSATHEPFRSIIWLVYRVMDLSNRPWTLARAVLSESNYVMFWVARRMYEKFKSHWRYHTPLNKLPTLEAPKTTARAHDDDDDEPKGDSSRETVIIGSDPGSP